MCFTEEALARAADDFCTPSNLRQIMNRMVDMIHERSYRTGKDDVSSVVVRWSTQHDLLHTCERVQAVIKGRILDVVGDNLDSVTVGKDVDPFSLVISVQFISPVKAYHWQRQ